MSATQDLEIKRLRELALRACYCGDVACTRFLEPPMEREALSAAKASGVHVRFWGGYPDAERRVAAFHMDEPPADADFPIACLELAGNPKYASPGHRDLLGAVMGLGLERDAIGDIAPGAADGRAYLFVHRDVADYIRANLESAGRAALKVEAMSALPMLREPEGTQRRATVSSERLDAVVAAGLKLSRSEAQHLIESGLVKRNHLPELRGDARLEEGDLLSIRGYGRMKILEFEGRTRKGRLAVRIFRYTA